MNINKLLILFLSLSLLTLAGKAGAKEDTAYLTFRKSAAGKPGTTIYTVRKGDSLLRIVCQVTGQTTNRLSIVRKYNPGLKDPNRIYPGQKIMLPLMTDTHPSSPSAKTVPRTADRPLAGATTSLIADPAFPSTEKWSVIKHILGEIGAMVTTRGKYYLPLRDMGQLNIDCGKIPMVEFPDRRMVFIDFRNQLPDDVTRLVSQTWKNIQVMRIDPRLPAPEILARLIGASGSHEMRPQNEPLKIGAPPMLQIRLDRIIIPKTVVATRPHKNLALRIRKDDGPALPGPIWNHALAQGWLLIDIKGGSLIKSTPESVFSPLPASRLSSQSYLELAADLFQKMNLEIGRNTDLKIFDAREDGFDLIIKTEMTIARGEKKLNLSNRRLPNQFLNILKKNRTEVITPDADETKTSFLSRSCQALGINHETGSFSLPLAAKGDMSDVAIVLSGMKITPDTGRPFYLTDIDPGEGINGYLSQAMGILVITY